MERLGQDTWHPWDALVGVRVQTPRRKAGDEHDLEIKDRGSVARGPVRLPSTYPA